MCGAYPRLLGNDATNCVYSETTRPIALAKLNGVIRAVKTGLRSMSNNTTGP